jgi:hypothetical protein
MGRDPAREPIYCAEDYANLDPGIRRAVQILVDAGIETFESYEGGQGHSYPGPAVRFRGGPDDGWVALGIRIALGLKPTDLKRVWYVLDRNDPTGPYWEITFREKLC